MPYYISSSMYTVHAAISAMQGLFPREHLRGILTQAAGAPVAQRVSAQSGQVPCRGKSDKITRLFPKRESGQAWSQRHLRQEVESGILTKPLRGLPCFGEATLAAERSSSREPTTTTATSTTTTTLQPTTTTATSTFLLYCRVSIV